MTSLLRPELIASLQSMLPKGSSKEEPSNVYRDPEPPMEMQNKPAPASGPVNPNAGMMGKALAIQREQNKKAMMNPSGTAASPSGRVRTGVPFNEAPRGRGQLPGVPRSAPSRPEPVMPPKNGRGLAQLRQATELPPERAPSPPVMPPEPVMPEREPPPRDIPMLVQRPPRQLDDEGNPIIKMYAKGGMVKTASSRGDGIASRGRTRGKIC